MTLRELFMRRIISGRSASCSLGSARDPSFVSLVVHAGQFPREWPIFLYKKKVPPGRSRARDVRQRKKRGQIHRPAESVRALMGRSSQERRTVNGLSSFCIFPRPFIPHPPLDEHQGSSVPPAVREVWPPRAWTNRGPASPLPSQPSFPDEYRGIVTDDKSVPRVLRFKRFSGAEEAVIAPRESPRI